jgi:uncharacterized membrane protein
VKDRVLLVGCVAYAALFTWLGAIKYAAHRNLVDFGIFAQTASSAFGCFCNPLEGSHWAFHFSPILYVAGVAVVLVHSPYTLIALQAIAGAACAPPVYAIVRAHGGDVLTARLTALVVWLYPPLAGLTFGDFHENGFAPAAVAWTLYLFDAGKLRWAALSAAVVLCVKEDQALFLAFAGVAGAYAYRDDGRRVRFCIAVTGVSLVVAAAFFFVIQPHANANPSWQPVRFYAWSAADIGDLLKYGLVQRLGFLALIFLPLALVPFRSRAIVLALPPLAEVLASRMSTTFTAGTHYAGAWIGYVLVAFAAGIADLSAIRRARPALYWSLALCAVELIAANPMHPGLNLRAPQARDAALDAELARLPDSVSIATQEEAYTHLALDDSAARVLPEFPSIPVRACLVLVDRDFPDSPRLVEYASALQAAVQDGRFSPIEINGGIGVYRRTGHCR